MAAADAALAELGGLQLTGATAEGGKEAAAAGWWLEGGSAAGESGWEEGAGWRDAQPQPQHSQRQPSQQQQQQQQQRAAPPLRPGSAESAAFLAVLSQQFPEYSEAVLADLLAQAGGSLEATLGTLCSLESEMQGLAALEGAGDAALEKVGGGGTFFLVTQISTLHGCAVLSALERACSASRQPLRVCPVFCCRLHTVARPALRLLHCRPAGWQQRCTSLR